MLTPSVQHASPAELDCALIRADVGRLKDLGLHHGDTLLAGELGPQLTETEGKLTSFLRSCCDGGPVPESVVGGESCHVAYVSGISLWCAFVRWNFAGPPGAELPIERGCPRAVTELFVDGEEPCSVVRYPQFLTAAKEILVVNAERFYENGLLFAPWWAARVSYTHHLVLERATPSLRATVFQHFDRFLGRASTVHGARHRPTDDAGVESIVSVEKARAPETSEEYERLGVGDVLPLAYMELCLAQIQFYDTDGAGRSLLRAEELLNVEPVACGLLGKRTKFQDKATSQLVVHVYLRDPDALRFKERGPLPLCPRGLNGTGQETESLDADRVPSVSSEYPERSDLDQLLPENVALNDSDVLGYVKLEGAELGNAAQSGASVGGKDRKNLADLHPFEQALVLCKALHELARHASDKLTEEEASPYVARVIDARESALGTPSVLQIRALALRSGFERDRGRYLERTMSQMESLSAFVDKVPGDFGKDVMCRSGLERVFYTLAGGMPPRWSLKKELAVSLGRLGLVKSAMDLFEQLEYWDELVDCHRLVGNLGAAERLVRNMLEGLDEAVRVADRAEHDALDAGLAEARNAKSRAQRDRRNRRPRLLCVLGDITHDSSCFELAWTESEGTCARAKRSLGRRAVEAGEWKAAIEHFQAALRVNSLYPEVWFTCGCAALEVADLELAARCFTRVVQETPENAEAWNNLGRVLCDADRQKEGLSALLEAARIMRESWRIWENVLLVATDLRSAAEIVRALDRLLDLRGKDGVQARAISVAVDCVIERLSAEPPQQGESEQAAADRKKVAATTCRSLLAVLSRATTLVSSDPAIWEAYAKLHAAVPGHEAQRKAAECRQRQLRALMSDSDWRYDVKDFKKVARATYEFASHALSSSDAATENAARLHLQSVMTQCAEDFGSLPAFDILRDADDILRPECG